MTTRAEVERAIDSAHDRDGVIVVERGGRLLATRDHLQGGGCEVIVMRGRHRQSPDPINRKAGGIFPPVGIWAESWYARSNTSCGVGGSARTAEWSRGWRAES